METPEVQQSTKTVLTPERIMIRNVQTMPNKQMSNRLRRLTRKQSSNMDGVWAIVLSTVFDNTKLTNVNGRLESYLR